jgi:hypothetical protein
MIKKKKKLSYGEQQKQLQQQQVQYKNLFRQKLREVCVAIGDATLYNLIPEVEITKLYYLRCAPLKIKVAKGAKIQKRMLDVMENAIKLEVGKTTIEMMPGSGRGIPLTDYILAGNVLEFVLAAKTCEVREKERFDEFVKHTDSRFNFYKDTVCRVCENVCGVFGNIIERSSLYAFNFEIIRVPSAELDVQMQVVGRLLSQPASITKGLQLLDSLDMRMHPTISIYTLPIEVKQLHVDGGNHTALQLCTVYYANGCDPELVHIRMPMKGIETGKELFEPSIPVYIQLHAVRRLIERTSCRVLWYAITQLCICAMHPVTYRLAGNKFLLKYDFEKLKVGYFLCEMVEECVLIRTFLFITNSGTPEGDKLAQLTNLQKADREYLCIDNLSTLLGSDINENEAICSLFRQAGCQSILDLSKKAEDNASLQRLFGIEKQTTSLASLLMEYLNPQADNDEYVVGE